MTKKIEYHNFSLKKDAVKSRKNVSKSKGSVSPIKYHPPNKKKKLGKTWSYKITCK